MPAVKLRWTALLVGAVTIATAGHAGARDDPATLRVCADPHNLPLSDEAEQGYENKIATLLAARMGVPLEYVWWPNTMGFIRNTLRAGKCDLVMGVVDGYELAATTAPYYRSTYALVTRADSGLAVTALDDPSLKGLRIGVIANTPPADLLVKHGLIGDARPYRLMVDTRREHPAEQMIADVASGAIDAALAWGPFAGYHAKRQTPPLAVTPLRSEAGAPPLEFSIAAGVRHGEPEWLAHIDRLLAENHAEITDILLRYGVPLVAEDEMPDRRTSP